MYRVKLSLNSTDHEETSIKGLSITTWYELDSNPDSLNMHKSCISHEYWSVLWLQQTHTWLKSAEACFYTARYKKFVVMATARHHSSRPHDDVVWGQKKHKLQRLFQLQVTVRCNKPPLVLLHSEFEWRRSAMIKSLRGGGPYTEETPDTNLTIIHPFILLICIY